MSRCGHLLPGFRAACLGIGATFTVIAASELAQGIPASLAGFGVPEVVLRSAHYQDAMSWVFTHMLFLGLIIAGIGHFADSVRTRQAFSRIMAPVIAVFLIMDIRTSDSPLGNGLYAGGRSLVPPVIDLVVLLLFAHLALCRTACSSAAAQADQAAQTRDRT